MSSLDTILLCLPIALMCLAMFRAWKVETAFSARLVLLVFVASLLNVARAIIVGRPVFSIFFFALSAVAAGWSYRKAVQGELMAEDHKRRRQERELDES